MLDPFTLPEFLVSVEGYVKQNIYLRDSAEKNKKEECGEAWKKEEV